MKTLILLAAIALTGCAQMGAPYYKVGLWHNFHETEFIRDVDCNGAIDIHVQLGFEVNENLSYGAGHVSDLKCGKPFRDDIEYTSDQIFIEYKGYFK